MEKELSEMTLQELWEMFPIFLVSHNDRWKEYYNELENYLQKVLEKYISKRISHIGSTAIKGIWSKNIVDVLVEIPKYVDIEEVAHVIEQAGFIKMSADSKRVSFNKGYTKKGFEDKVYHIHLRYFGDNDELYFRDYLNDFPEIAKEYEALKLKLWKKYEYNRDAYTEAKGDFVKSRTLEARKLYGDRYS
ncbi:MAG: GrpB family protein [Abditibacteriota bacterium]|nr:GrpB family protein [Abditibacteriota bacterium]